MSHLAFSRGPQLVNSRFYMGNLMSFLLRGDETGGRLSITEGSGKLGNEPPPHVHFWENEIYYILEGEAEFFIEGTAEIVFAKQGDIVFLPQGKAHAVYFRSEVFRTLLMVQSVDERAVGLDKYFREISEPAQSMSLPKEQTTYAGEDASGIEAAISLALVNGVQFLSPDDTKARLPNYPGFGANLHSASREK